MSLVLVREVAGDETDFEVAPAPGSILTEMLGDGREMGRGFGTGLCKTLPP